MNNFMVFAFDHYYPRGGMKDFKGYFNKLEEAENFGKTLSYDYIQIYNKDTTRINYIDKTDGIYGGRNE